MPEKFSYWSVLKTEDNNPDESVRWGKLLNDPDAIESFANPLRFGLLSIDGYFNAKDHRDYKYKQQWPVTPRDLAHLWIACGITKEKIIETLVRQQRVGSPSETSRLLLTGLALYQHFGIEPTVKLAQATLAPLQESRKDDRIERALCAFTPDKESQTYWINYYVNKYNTLESLNYGDEGTGVMLAHVYNEADPQSLIRWATKHQDFKCLAYLVIQNRLDLSDFLEIASTYKASKSQPRSREAWHDDTRSDEGVESDEITSCIEKLIHYLPDDHVHTEITKYTETHDTTFYETLVTFPKEDESIQNWVLWQELIQRVGLGRLNSETMSGQLDQLQSRLLAISQNTTLEDAFSFHPTSDWVKTKLAPFAAQHENLATLGLHILIRSAPRYGDATDYVKRHEQLDTWLSKADATLFLNRTLLNRVHMSREKYLSMATALLPLLNNKAQAELTPVVAYAYGVKQGPSAPKTIRSGWKELDPARFKKPIPNTFQRDNYILMALTGKDPKDVMDVLNSMDVRTTQNVYIDTIYNWVAPVYGVDIAQPPINSELFEVTL